MESNKERAARLIDLWDDLKDNGATDEQVIEEFAAVLDAAEKRGKEEAWEECREKATISCHDHNFISPQGQAACISCANKIRALPNPYSTQKPATSTQEEQP